MLFSPCKSEVRPRIYWTTKELICVNIMRMAQMVEKEFPKIYLLRNGMVGRFLRILA